MIQIKKIGLENADTLLRISIETFFAAFAHQNTKENMEEYSSTAFTNEKVGNELSNPDSEFYFVFVKSEIAGYMKLNYNSAQTEFQGIDAMEIERIYVLADYQNQKLGLQLFNFAQKKAFEKSLSQIWLGVWENNDKAIRFYERQGFEVFGEHKFMLGKDKQTDLLMRKLLN